jgi:hypothetical protein
MKLSALTPVFAIVALAGLALADEPCVAEGKTNTVTFDRPPLGQPGDPVTAEWTPKAAEAFEDDPISADDKMGTMSNGATSDTASVEVENKGGNLSGPNGEVQNGTGEGACIEVKAKFEYKYQTTHQVCTATMLGVPGVGSITVTRCTQKVVWAYAYKETTAKTVCPC